MTKIIIGTNVIVSAVIGNGYASMILQRAIFDIAIIVCISSEVLAEYEKVARYNRIQKKYPNYKDSVLKIIESLQEIARLYKPTVFFDIIKDKDDNIFLDLANEAQAHYIVTGNYIDFTFDEFGTTKIVNPRSFWNLYEEGRL